VAARLAQFKDFFAILLEVAGAITLVTALVQGDSTNLKVAVAIFAVVMLNGGHRLHAGVPRRAHGGGAEADAPRARACVLQRDGTPTDCAAEELVPGDVVVLAEGDAISADGRLIAVAELATLDAALAGESEPVRRQSQPVLEDVPRIQARNLVFAGTTVSSGTGRAVVFGTGADTEFGRVTAL
jgi:Ca2+-transporting ATPase